MPKRKKPSCPVCKKHAPAWCALMDTFQGEGKKRHQVPAHQSSVCQRCWLDQYEERYGVKIQDVPYDLDPVVAKEKGVPAYKAPE